MTTTQGNVAAYARYVAATNAPAVSDDTVGILDNRFEGWAVYGDPRAAALVGFDRMLVHVEPIESFQRVLFYAPSDQPEGFSKLGGSSKSAFEELDDMRPEAEKVEELISYVRRSLDVPFRVKLANRLKHLVVVTIEEAPDQSEISASSLRMFVHFLQSSTGLERPDVTVTTSGNIRAYWRVSSNKLCAVEFFPDGEVHFVIFAPNPDALDETLRLSGRARVDSFLGVARREGASEWMIHEGRSTS